MRCRMGLLMAPVATLIAASLLLSGCFTPKTTQNQILEPPLIPPPVSVKETVSTTPAFNIQSYADMLDWGNTREYSPLLPDAVRHALELGVLKPTSVQERFEPTREVTYGEFRDWAMAYQTVLYGYGMLPSGATLAENSALATLSAVKPSAGIVGKAELTSPMNPEKLSILPEAFTLGNQTLVSGQPLTREALCQLYFVLMKQDVSLQQLSIAQIEAMMPENPRSGPEERFAQVKDYASINPAVRAGVGSLYKSEQLQQLFKVTTDHLTVDDGFHPKKPVTREQAIVMLHWIYGAVKPNIAPASVSSAQALDIEHAVIRTPNAINKVSPALPVSPMSQLKTYEERGPQGARQTLQIQGAE